MARSRPYHRQHIRKRINRRVVLMQGDRGNRWPEGLESMVPAGSWAWGTRELEEHLSCGPVVAP